MTETLLLVRTRGDWLSEHPAAENPPLEGGELVYEHERRTLAGMRFLVLGDALNVGEPDGRRDVPTRSRRAPTIPSRVTSQ
jgi:hypothetical protein